MKKPRGLVFAVCCAISLCGMMVHSSAVPASPRHNARHGKSSAPQRKSANQTLIVGWHDEMRDPADWEPLGMENQAESIAAPNGALTLLLPQVPQGFPYTFQWSGVTRTAMVDIGRYPILVARVSRLGPHSYAHLDIEERDFLGRQVHILRSPTLTQPGLSVIDIGKEWGENTRRIVLRLIVGGDLSGASCDYDWVRFVRREDLPRLQANPRLTTIRAAGGAIVRSSHPAGPEPSLRSLPEPRRITFRLRQVVQDATVPHRTVGFFVETGSLAPSLVTLADNAGFPEVQSLYSHPVSRRGRRGIHVQLVFVGDTPTTSDPAFAINVWQPSMPGSGAIFRDAPAQTDAFRF